MKKTTCTIEGWDGVELYASHWPRLNFAAFVFFKPSMFVFGFEAFKGGGLLFIGPLAIGFGGTDISDDKQ